MNKNQNLKWKWDTCCRKGHFEKREVGKFYVEKSNIKLARMKLEGFDLTYNEPSKEGKFLFKLERLNELGKLSRRLESLTALNNKKLCEINHKVSQKKFIVVKPIWTVISNKKIRFWRPWLIFEPNQNVKMNDQKFSMHKWNKYTHRQLQWPSTLWTKTFQ